MTTQIAAEFDDDGPQRGRPLVDAARAVGAGWVVLRVGSTLGGLQATARAAAEGGLGLIVRLDDTGGIADLADTLHALGEQSVTALRDRLLIVVPTERIGKRLRADAKWAPSAADLATVQGSYMGFFRKFAPVYVRASCDTDDLVVPHGFFPPPKLVKLADKLRTRGARLWIEDVPPDEVEPMRDGPAFGLIVSR
ncbi:MAG: hypothetical protein K8T90_04105 [Planctomycetes bacterium]|nr:hypothetical protein [Planctomycetota bacterium]